MQDVFVFLLYSVLLGAALAMDAFSISVTYGLSDPRMPFPNMFRIAFCFAAFQFAMPLIGWFCVRQIEEAFTAFSVMIPWIALLLLGVIGGKMLLEGIEKLSKRRAGIVPERDEMTSVDLEPGKLLALGVATSIDALSVGFTISEYGTLRALLCSLIIGAVTYVICAAGIRLGKKFGLLLNGLGDLLGGVILLLIGLGIFLRR